MKSGTFLSSLQAQLLQARTPKGMLTHWDTGRDTAAQTLHQEEAKLLK